MMTDKILLIGRIGGAHGIKGWVKVNSYTKPIENIITYQPWLLRDKESWKEITIVDYKLSPKNILVQLPGCHDRNTASAYTNTQIAIYRHQLAKLQKNEYYWTDLEGLTVINKDNECLGKVVYLFETGANDVLVVQGEKEYLIPYVLNQYILEVNLKEKTLLVDWS